MEDYASAWLSERGRCHRLVYDEHGKPEHCPEPPVAVGWRYEGHTRTWHAVDACERHRSQFVSTKLVLTGRRKGRGDEFRERKCDNAFDRQ